MIIDCISDLHGKYPTLEGGDLLIVAGDLTARDLETEMELFDYWLYQQKYNAKIVIGGNHDNVLQQKRLNLQFGTYFEDSGCSFNGFKMWGSPWTTRFKGMNPHCMAFTVDTDKELAEKWALIPEDTDILVCHSPAYALFDAVECGDKIEFVGSPSLRHTLERIKPKLFVCGHIHEGYGHMIFKHVGMDTHYVNASHVDEWYRNRNKPIRIIL